MANLRACGKQNKMRNRGFAETAGFPVSAVPASYPFCGISGIDAKPFSRSASSGTLSDIVPALYDI